MLDYRTAVIKRRLRMSRGSLPLNTVLPVISGTTTVGQTLTTTNGTWTGTGVILYSYQWMRDGVAIVGAVLGTYVLVAADAATNITCVVSATDDVGTTPATSNSLGPILASIYALVNGGSPALIADHASTAGVNGMGYYYNNGVETDFSTVFQPIRSGKGTVLDSDGLIKWGAHNIETYSSDTTRATLGVVNTDNVVVAPDGTTTADLQTEDTSAGRHENYTYHAADVSADKYRGSVFFRKKDRDHASIQVKDNVGNYNTAVFNLTGVGSVTTSINSGSGISSGISQLAAPYSAWYYCWVEITLGSNTAWFEYGLSDSGTPAWSANAPAYTGDGVSGLYMWGLCLQNRSLGMQDNPDSIFAGTPAAAYVPTGVGVTKYERRVNYNTAGTATGVLVEEARTNLNSAGSDFSGWVNDGITDLANSIASPSGSTDATKITTDAGVSQHRMYKSLGSSDTNSVHSVYLKAGTQQYVGIGHNNPGDTGITVDLTAGTIVDTWASSTPTVDAYGIETLANGWFRVWCKVYEATPAWYITLHSIASSTSGNGSWDAGAGGTYFYVWGDQFEAGYTASSYIPTITSTLTRVADKLAIKYAQVPDTTGNELSVQYDGLTTYADENNSIQFGLFSWYQYSTQWTGTQIQTNGSHTGTPLTYAKAGGAQYSNSVFNPYSPGTDVAINNAVRLTSTKLNAAALGSAATETAINAFPTIITADMEFGTLAYAHSTNCITTYGLIRIWNSDILDAGIVEATT